MSNSREYYNEMLTYREKISIANKKIEKCENLISSFQKIENLQSIDDELKEAKTFIENGFVTDGKTFDDGEIESCRGDIANIQSKSRLIQTNINKCIETEKENIKSYEQGYNNAKTNYLQARKNEMED